MTALTTSIMVSATLLTLLAEPALADAPSCAAIRLPNQTADAETVKRLEMAWLTAEYRGDVTFLDCLLSPGYSVIGAKTGAIHRKADLLASFAKSKGSTRDIPPLTSSVVLNGIYATAFSTMKGLKQNGESFEASFVDSYVFENGHWEAVGGVDF